MKELTVLHTKAIQRFTEQDLSLVSKKEKNILFDSLKDRIDVVISWNDIPLIYKKNTLNYQVKVDSLYQSNSLMIDPETDLKDSGYELGEFTCDYRFLRKALDTPLYISAISADRTQVTLSSLSVTEDVLKNIFTTFKGTWDNRSYYAPTLLYNIQVGASVITDFAFSNGSIVVSLYEELPADFTVKQEIEVLEEISNSQLITVELRQIIEKTPPKVLRPPFLNKKDATQTGTDFVIGENIDISDSTDFFVDYSDFNNFVHFGSARERVINFIYKIATIEVYEEKGDSASIADVISKFTDYEKYLYSIFPTSGNDRLQLNSVTVTNWIGDYVSETDNYTGLLGEADEFDKSNPDYIIYFLPNFIRENENNKPALTFCALLGEFYDEVWLSTRQITKNLDKSLPNGSFIDKSKVETALLNSGFVYKLLNTDGSNVQNNINREFYTKLNQNVPYYLKTRGTEEGIRALLTTMGISETLVKLQKDSLEIESEVISNNMAKATITTPFKLATKTLAVQTIEFRSKLKPSTTLFNVSDRIILTTTTTKIQLSLKGTTTPTLLEVTVPLDDSVWYYIALTFSGTTVTLYVGNENGYWSNVSGTIPSAASFTLSETVTATFNFSTCWTQELRFWKQVISEDVLKRRLENPFDITATAKDSFYSDLILRLPLGANGKTTSPLTTSEHYNTTLTDYTSVTVANLSYSKNTEYLKKYKNVQYVSYVDDVVLNRIANSSTLEEINDDNTMHVGFSQVYELDRDIKNTFSVTDLEESQDETTTHLASIYYQKITDAILNNNFIRNVEPFGFLINNTLEEFIPSRVKVNTGVYIKPHILQDNRFSYTGSIAQLTAKTVGFNTKPNVSGRRNNTVFSSSDSPTYINFSKLKRTVIAIARKLQNEYARKNRMIKNTDSFVGSVKSETSYSAIMNQAYLNPVFENDTFFKFNYLIDSDKNIIDLNSKNNHWNYICNIFKNGSLINLTQLQQKVSLKSLYNKSIKVIESGYDYDPYFYFGEKEKSALFDGETDVAPHKVKAKSTSFTISPTDKIIGVYNSVLSDDENLFTIGDVDSYAKYDVPETGSYLIASNLKMKIYTENINANIKYRYVAYKNSVSKDNIIYYRELMFCPRFDKFDANGNVILKDISPIANLLSDPTIESGRDAFSRYWAYSDTSVGKGTIPYNSTATWLVSSTIIKNGNQYVIFKNNFGYTTPPILNAKVGFFVDYFYPEATAEIDFKFPNISSTTSSGLGVIEIVDNLAQPELKYTSSTFQQKDKILIGLEIINSSDTESVKAVIDSNSYLTIRQDAKLASDKNGLVTSLGANKVTLSKFLIPYLNQDFVFKGDKSVLFSKYGQVNDEFTIEVGDGIKLYGSNTGNRFYAAITSVDIKPDSINLTLASQIPSDFNTDSISEFVLVKKKRDETIVRVKYRLSKTIDDLALTLPQNISTEFVDKIGEITKYIKETIIINL